MNVLVLVNVNVPEIALVTGTFTFTFTSTFTGQPSNITRGSRFCRPSLKYLYVPPPYLIRCKVQDELLKHMKLLLYKRSFTSIRID